jgi:putative peptidoglycan lipid II flippase
VSHSSSGGNGDAGDTELTRVRRPRRGRSLWTPAYARPSGFRQRRRAISDFIEPVSELPPQGRLTRRSGTFIGSVNLGARLLDRASSFGQIIILAAVFGATRRADLYFIAAIVPLTIGTIVGEPFGRGLMTLLLQTKTRERQLAVAASGFLVCAVMLVALTTLYADIAYLVVRVSSPAGDSSYAPWLVFSFVAPALGLSGYLGGLLVWLEKYTAQAFLVPLVNSAGLVALGVAVVFSDRVVWAAAAVVSGYILACMFAFILVSRELGATWFARVDAAALRQVFASRKSVISPILGGLVGNQVVVMIERVFASTLGPGAIATLSYARGISTAPATLSQAVGAGVYPGIARADASGSQETVRNLFLTGLRLNVYLGAVFAVYIGLFSTPLMAFLLQRGEFQVASSERAGRALAAFALSTFATSLLMYVIAVLYGVGGFKGLLYRSLTVLGSYLLLAPFFLFAFGATGLALAFSLAQTAGALLAVVLVSSRLSLTALRVVRTALVPVLGPIGAVATTLVAYRAMTLLVDVRIAWRGYLDVAGSGLVFCIASAVALLAGSLPEARRLRQFGAHGLKLTLRGLRAGAGLVR